MLTVWKVWTKQCANGVNLTEKYHQNTKIVDKQQNS